MVRNTIGFKMKALLVICLVALARTQDVMENNLFEGDMELSPQEIEKVYEGDGVDPNAPLAARVSGHWPGGIIAYTMSTDISSSARAVAAIDDAIKDYHQSTCLRFVKRTNEKAYINFVKGSGCSSPVGYRGRVNTINLASGCWYKGIVAHEIAHSLGFFHEQSRPDRDHYVRILWQNIQAGRSHNFQKRGSDVHSMNVPYDFKSLMHYRATSFGSGKVTIDPYDPKMKGVIGQRGGLSDLDKLQMNLLYKCTGFTSPKPASLPPIPTTTIPITARPTPETNAAKAVNCPFDYGMCNWRNDAHYDQFDWSRIKGSTPSTGTGPSADHSGKGYYVFIETSSPRARGDVARLRTPLIAASSNSRCFNFYYHMYGSTMGSFSVYINYKLMNTSSRSLLLFKKNGQQGNVWLPGQADIPAQPYAFEIVLQGESGGPYTGDIAVDDVSITNGSCSKVVTTQRPTTRRQTTQPRTTQPRTTQPRTTQPKTTHSPPTGVDCTFDSGMCSSWSNVKGDQFDWSRHSGSTGSADTGPERDHSGTGYYMYIETSSPRKVGDSAELQSRPLEDSCDDRCLTFYYHMYGQDINKLNVSLRSNGQDTLLWELRGKQKDGWLQGTIPISKDAPQYARLVFTGVRGNGYQGDIAIDDIVMNKQSNCSIYPAAATPRPIPPVTTQKPVVTTQKPVVTTPKPVITTQKPIVSSADCDFEGGMCKWVNERSSDVFDWTRRAGSTPSSATGPSVDHTKGTSSGYYLYIETSSPRTTGHNAILRSAAISGSSSPGCFDFWYHMYGTAINQLKVSVKTMAGANTVMWLLKGHQGSYWKRAKVPIPASNGTFSIILEGIAGNSYTGDIAIDDLKYSTSLCTLSPPTARPSPPTARPPPPPTTRPPPPPTTRPTRPPTIKPNVSLTDCDFEQGGMCKWVNERSSDVFDWTRRAGSTPSSATGPSTDHTKGTSSGYYLYIETSSPRTTGHNAILKSASISGSPRPSCFGFWYHMYGATVNQLKVSVKTMAGANTVMWLLKGQQGSTWQRASVPIPASNGTFSIMMEGISGSSYTGDISIDDLSYVQRSCQLSPSNARPPTPTTPGPPTPPPPTLAPGSCGISPVPHSRVIGGKDAVVGAWPWQAALRTSSGRFFCGGSLINNQWILTAAHCIGSSSPSYYKITLGDHNRLANEGTEKDFTVSKVIKNPNYHQGASYNNDAALLKLSRPVLITKRISPVCLPLKSEVVAVGTKCYITGWGKIRHPGSSHTILQQAVMPIRSKKDCADRLAKSPYAGRLKITDQMVCAGNLGNSTIISGCHGDSGGPLVCQKPSGEFQLHGAVSWGSPKCSIQQLYTVFARITAVKDWIDRTVQQN